MKYERNPQTGRMWYNLTGERFGRWTVLECTGRRQDALGRPIGTTTWKCQCECGRIKENVNYGALVGGKSTSCGCFRGEVLGHRAKKHGDSSAKAYIAWQQAKDRCFNSARPSWNRYGGRGITMCDGLCESYPDWRDLLGPAPTPRHSVDRKDNEKNYSCGKCQQCVGRGWEMNIHWATKPEQANNTRANQKRVWEGCKRSLTEIARMENVAYCSLRNKVIQDQMRVLDAVSYCRDRGLIFNERAKSVLEANPSITTRPPKNRRNRKKSVPNPVD